MSFSRARKYAGIRCKGHDYRSRCIYHIVLKKADNVSNFSQVVGFVGSHDWPPSIQLSSSGECIAKAISNLKSKFPFTLQFPQPRRLPRGLRQYHHEGPCQTDESPLPRSARHLHAPRWYFYYSICQLRRRRPPGYGAQPLVERFPRQLLTYARSKKYTDGTLRRHGLRDDAPRICVGD